MFFRIFKTTCLVTKGQSQQPKTQQPNIHEPQKNSPRPRRLRR